MEPRTPENRSKARRWVAAGTVLATASIICAGPMLAKAAEAPKAAKRPNILFIMGDDVGWFNIGAYHRGMMSGKTPNLDKLAAQGMMFTDYYAEASCTAGRAARRAAAAATVPARRVTSERPT